jgi:hypothetical protein
VANCGFAAIFAAPKLAGLRQQERSAAERQSYGAHPKMGALKQTVWQWRAAKVSNVAEKLPRAQTALREGLSLLAAAIAISSQATVLAYQ